MARTNRPSRHFRLVELAAGVHAAVATDGGFALCNSGIVDLGGATLIFDSGLTPQSGADLARAAESLTGRPADFLVNSHYHHDHIRGNQVFATRRIIATAETWELVRTRAKADIATDRKEAKKRWDELRTGHTPAAPRDRAVLRGWYEGILRSLPRLRLTLPNLTFDSELVLRGTRRTARVITYGGGHSPSDTFVFLPDDRVAMLGDLLFNGYLPSINDGNPDRLVRILDRIGELRARTFLPGHGAPGGPRALADMRSYVSSARERVERHRRAGRPRAELARLQVPPKYRSWKFADFYPATLDFLYGWGARR